MTRPKQLLTLAAAAFATSTPWPRLDEALANYPSIHARETAKIKAGDKSAKFVLVVCYQGGGCRTAVMESQRTTTWTTSAAVAAAARARSRNAMSGAEFFEREAELGYLARSSRARHDVEIIEWVVSPQC